MSRYMARNGDLGCSESQKVIFMSRYLAMNGDLGCSEPQTINIHEQIPSKEWLFERYRMTPTTLA